MKPRRNELRELATKGAEARGQKLEDVKVLKLGVDKGGGLLKVPAVISTTTTTRLIKVWFYHCLCFLLFIVADTQL